jgi:hypothetical protein
MKLVCHDPLGKDGVVRGACSDEAVVISAHTARSWKQPVVLKGSPPRL